MRGAAAAFLLLLATAGAAEARNVAVDFLNASRPTRCAEEDNVYVKISGAAITRFRLQATLPTYFTGEASRRDNKAPDFTACDMSHDPSFAFAPRTVVLYEDRFIRLVGHSYANFWRADTASVRVGARTEEGLHLLQLFRLDGKRATEILVVYPGDGYWRPKPLPPAGRPETAYGSSFLFGPIEESSRPFVALSAIEFEPATLSFRLDFAAGGHGTVNVVEAVPKRLTLILTLDPPLPAGRPFAALRSMFVTPAQADVAKVALPGAAPRPILAFGRATARAARFGRSVRSDHNTSAPDLSFSDFRAAASRP